jgi:hypothetical protein
VISYFGVVRIASDGMRRLVFRSTQMLRLHRGSGTGKIAVFKWNGRTSKLFMIITRMNYVRYISSRT